MSTAMIGSHPAIFAAIRPDNPTAPTPNTANGSPGRGCIVLSTAPAPVCPLQASGPSRSSGASFRNLHGEALVGDRVGRERRLLEEGAVDRLAVSGSSSVEPSGRVPRILRSKFFWQCHSIWRRQLAQVPHHGNDMTT